ncbi:MAG: TonB-dependent receptor [Muribaculaceae bacterium]|nr:TonB-dependent receptor [Muribaculaceae bacterium]
MKLKLFLLLLLAAILPSAAQTPATQTIVGVVVNSNTGSPVAGAKVLLREKGVTATTNFNGDFRLNVPAGTGMDYLVVMSDAYDSYSVNVGDHGNINLGEIRLLPAGEATEFYGDQEDLMFDEAVVDDEEGASQSIAALTGSNDNLYYSTASYNFSPMYFRFRGYDSMYQSVYINGIRMNDLIRGRFNFSSLLGMTSRAFRNKTTNVGIEAANYGFGDLGGAVNYNTTTDLYAPGFNGSVAYTNSNYMLRAMATWSSGLNDKGWAYTVSAIGRYAKEGVMAGTFYNSAGLFLSVEKKLNDANSLTLTAFGGPTQRATGRATYQEAYDLAGSNLYNPDWGWQDGKKRSSRITETFDPTVILNWIYKKNSTVVNTAAAFRSVYYNRTALQYYKANDPNPTYYRYLPSYYANKKNEEDFDYGQYDYYTYLWKNDENFRQIKWDELYQVNALNDIENQTLPADQQKGSSYIMENRINKQLNGMFNTYVNTRLNSFMTLQGGFSFNYTKSSNYKTVRDLLGGQFWLDVDPFSDRDITLAPDNLQNDLDNPNRHVGKGDKFGYDYDIYALQASIWAQNVITLPHWDINYGFQVDYTQYQRDGHMRNGRAPNNSLGKSEMLRFDTGALKIGATYKIDGRNQIVAHAQYGTRAPLFDNVFVAPRVKNTVVGNVEPERNIALDASYVWNIRKFRGSVTGFYTDIQNAIERNGFYDEQYQTYANYVLQGVRRVYKGIEVGMAYKVTPSLTATFAGSFARFRYKNNPSGTRTFENGLHPDTTQTVYLKNYCLGSTPQTNANLGLDYAAPKNWFFNLNGTIQADSYVNLSPSYHEALPGLWSQFGGSEAELEAKIKELCYQDKLKTAFTLNLSIGKVIYFNRKVSMNINVSVNNLLNNRNIVTYAYQQGRLDTQNYDREAYPNRLSYAQGVRVFANVGVRF